MSSLATIPFFKDVKSHDFAKLDHLCSWRKYEEGQVVIDYDDASDDVFFIVSGDVRILIRTAAGREIILADFKAGQYFGELAAIDGARRSANVTAMTKVELCSLPAPAFRDIMFSEPSCCDQVLRMLARRVRDLDRRLAEHTVLDVKHRLYSELLRLSTPRLGHDGERIVTPPPFHHVFASRIGCRREQVSREFSALAEEQLIVKLRGGLVLSKPKVLEARIVAALRTAD